MSYFAKVGSFNIDTTKTAGQSQSISSLGFQPKIVLFWWGGSTATGDSVSSGTYNIGFGAGISSSSRFAINGMSEDAQAASDTARSHYNTECIRCYTDADTLDGIADFASLDADGFTLTIDDQFTQQYRISYLALGGTDLTNVAISALTAPTSTGNYSATDTGFQPDAILLFTAGRATINSAGLNIYHGMGMGTGASNQGNIMAYVADAAATSNTLGYGYNGEIIGPGANFRDALVSLDAGGFTLNHLEGASAYVISYIALKGGKYSVGDITTRTDTNDIAETVGTGWPPVALLFMSANRALSTQDTPTDHARMSIGAATSTSNRACAAISDEDALADTETAFANYDTAVYAFVQDDATVGLMDIKSIDAGGFTAVMDDADPSACWVTYLAIGAADYNLIKIRPNADTYDGNWTNQDGNNTNLYASVDEETINDDDYIQSELSPSISPIVLKLSNGVEPETKSNFTLRARCHIYPSNTTETVSGILSLNQGYVDEDSQGTVIFSTTISGLSTTLTTFEFPLTTEQINSITDYTDLYLRIVADT